jgi:hypothetical protein
MQERPVATCVLNKYCPAFAETPSTLSFPSNATSTAGNSSRGPVRSSGLQGGLRIVHSRAYSADRVRAATGRLLSRRSGASSSPKTYRAVDPRSAATVRAFPVASCSWMNVDVTSDLLRRSGRSQRRTSLDDHAPCGHWEARTVIDGRSCVCRFRSTPRWASGLIWRVYGLSFKRRRFLNDLDRSERRTPASDRRQGSHSHQRH